MNTNLINEASADAVYGLPPMLTAAQAARILNVSERTVARMCANGDMKAAKVCSVWRINRDALLDQYGLAKVS